VAQTLEFENHGDDIIIMNIPREGNADLLNKSTKLTLSSKKQYENHLQGIPIHHHVKTNQSNQYDLQLPSNINQPQIPIG
jgi:hypothetical protein